MVPQVLQKYSLGSFKFFGRHLILQVSKSDKFGQKPDFKHVKHVLTMLTRFIGQTWSTWSPVKQIENILIFLIYCSSVKSGQHGQTRSKSGLDETYTVLRLERPNVYQKSRGTKPLLSENLRNQKHSFLYWEFTVCVQINKTIIYPFLGAIERL